MCDTSHQPFHVYSFAALGLLFVDLLHGGTIALGIIHGAYYTEEEKTRQLNAASGLAETCATMFHQQKSGLSPEFVRFGDGGMTNGVDYYILPPETVETKMERSWMANI